MIITDGLPKIVSNWAVLTAYVRGNVELSYLAAASFIAHRHDGFWLLFQQKNNGMLPNSMHYVLIEQKKKHNATNYMSTTVHSKDQYDRERAVARLATRQVREAAGPRSTSIGCNTGVAPETVFSQAL